MSALLLLSFARPAMADYAVSDLLIVLDSDGRSQTVQHTIASSGSRIRLQLPGSIIPQEVMFFGADREASELLYNNDPTLIEIQEGSAFARYQHQYGDEVRQTKPGHYTLTTQSIPESITFVETPLNRTGITWVFPVEFEVVSYTVTDPDIGRWVSANNTLTFHQLSDSPVTLSINYKNKSIKADDAKPLCSDIGPPSDTCSEDTDTDGVPDYRDICVNENDTAGNAFGCSRADNMILSDIVFETGRTYLDVSARNLLDRVAYALLHDDVERRYFEVGAHTDNVGSAESNRQLSQKRADAVRHYLLLRGVNPNTLLATGYGEAYPIRDNTSTEGKRANRRVELVEITR